MILKKEITEKSIEWKVPPETVDKDWVLGHFLSAFYSIDEHKEKLVFKGGTALRKCYFPDYRFSEDLDFTSRTTDYKLTRKLMNKIIKIAEDNSGILFHLKEITEVKFEDKLTGYQARLKYWGANHSKNQEPPNPKRWTTNMKVEITLFEKMIFEPELKKITHPYSDSLLKDSTEIFCYNLKEVIAEKIRALIQRSYSAPRDYYDIYYLKDSINQKDWKQIKLAFLEKMKFKKLKYENVEQLMNKKSIKIIKTAWGNSLKHQITKEKLPDADVVVKELKEILNKNL
ncbi:MAG TPA: nucleotidyl transferase AbiEii/AbiGii toxin family protein [Ignavibacteria bacterium]|nr:nucleotidyl transferase AbiEii/AbiGii toxin family protein [Ignavibacteria bacterium]